MSRDRLVRQIVQLTPLILGLLGMWWGQQGKAAGAKASSDAAVAQDAVVALSNDMNAVPARLAKVESRVAVVEKSVKLVKLAIGSSGGQRVAARSGEQSRPAGVVPGSPGLAQKVAGGVAAFGRGFWHAIGGG